MELSFTHMEPELSVLHAQISGNGGRLDFLPPPAVRRDRWQNCLGSPLRLLHPRGSNRPFPFPKMPQATYPAPREEIAKRNTRPIFTHLGKAFLPNISGPPPNPWIFHQTRPDSTMDGTWHKRKEHR